MRIKCGAAKRVRVKARCVMRDRDVNFGAFLNFLQKTVQSLVTLRSKKYALTCLGFKCLVGTLKCLILTHKSKQNSNRDTQEKHTKTTCLASTIIPNGID